MGFNQKMDDIDVVYTWVDGDDSTFVRQLRKHQRCQSASATLQSSGPSRFRNNGELKYSLRSLEAFAPWVRKVYLVTQGQLPRWLETSHERISIVTHDMIFLDKSQLPTFNSNAIELQLHRIPNLSQQFLYFNDDVFLGRAISRGDFITTSGGQYIYVQPTPLHRNLDEGLVHDRAYAHTQRIVERLWHQRGARLLPAHVPQLYDRDLLAHLEHLLAEEFRETSSHRFRAANDLVLRVLYYCFLRESPEGGKGHEVRLITEGSHDYHFLRLEDQLWWMCRAFWQIRSQQPKFFCINDDLGEVSTGHKILRILRFFLRSSFPRPSSFERRQ
jgi:stealth protein CR2/Stealth-like protein